MRATVTMAGMSVIHILVTPTGLDPLQRSLLQKEQCSGASKSAQMFKVGPIFAHERMTCLIPLARLKNIILTKLGCFRVIIDVRYVFMVISTYNYIPISCKQQILHYFSQSC